MSKKHHVFKVGELAETKIVFNKKNIWIDAKIRKFDADEQTYDLEVLNLEENGIFLKEADFESLAVHVPQHRLRMKPTLVQEITPIDPDDLLVGESDDVKYTAAKTETKIPAEKLTSALSNTTSKSENPKETVFSASGREEVLSMFSNPHPANDKIMQKIADMIFDFVGTDFKHPTLGAGKTKPKPIKVKAVIEKAPKIVSKRKCHKHDKESILPLKQYPKEAVHDYGGWAASDVSKVIVRTSKYLKTRSQSDKKEQEVPLVMRPVGFEIFQGSSTSPDHLAIKPECSFYEDIQANHPDRYFVLINLMVTGVKTSVLSVFALDKENLEKQPPSWRILWNKFIEGDNDFRDRCFKLFVHIREGPWMLRQICPCVPTLLGQKVTINYIRGENYFELDIMADQSTLAWGAIKIAYPASKSIIVDLSYILQAETEDELPELAFAGIQLQRIDLKKGIPVKN